MPLIIDPTDFERWLTAATPPADLLRPFPANEMEAYLVSKAVNSPAKDGGRHDRADRSTIARAKGDGCTDGNGLRH